LDATSRDVLIKIIKEKNQKGTTFVVVSHSKDILELAENGILLCNGKNQDLGENQLLMKKYFGQCEVCDEKNNCI
ncbi:hypothetical protein LR002_01745, partial [Candidatus Gracilibacteria bacterium]|nr:hypothetical protein [Candidatus Gracilibacteria bacterium]